MAYVRLLYVSKTTKQHHEIKHDLMAILTTAVRFNSKNEITGVLYYGNGYFVQCLEGEEKAVYDVFYNRIVKDSRHQNCEILSYKPVDELLFQRWSMKFAPLNKKLRDFFQQYHVDEFNPYLLTHQTTEPFIELLSQEPHQEVDHSPHSS